MSTMTPERTQELTLAAVAQVAGLGHQLAPFLAEQAAQVERLAAARRALAASWWGLGDAQRMATDPSRYRRELVWRACNPSGYLRAFWAMGLPVPDPWGVA